MKQVVSCKRSKVKVHISAKLTDDHVVMLDEIKSRTGETNTQFIHRQIESVYSDPYELHMDNMSLRTGLTRSLLVRLITSTTNVELDPESGELTFSQITQGDM